MPREDHLKHQQQLSDTLTLTGEVLLDKGLTWYRRRKREQARLNDSAIVIQEALSERGLPGAVAAFWSVCEQRAAQRLMGIEQTLERPATKVLQLMSAALASIEIAAVATGHAQALDRFYYSPEERTRLRAREEHMRRRHPHWDAYTVRWNAEFSIWLDDFERL